MLKFSVIIPVYNVEKYLPCCLESCINQSEKDAEFICIDDCSTDDSYSILTQYAKKDPRIKVFKTEENKGQGTVRNLGIDISKGEYLLFVDPDDWVEENAFEKIYNHLKETNAQILQFDWRIYEEKKGIFLPNDFKSRLLKKINFDIAKEKKYSTDNDAEFVYACISSMVWNKAFKASFIKENNIKFSSGKLGEDVVFSTIATLSTKEVCFLDECLYNYRRRPLSTTGILSGSTLCVFENFKIIKEFLISKGLFEKYEKEYQNYVLNSCISSFCLLAPCFHKEYKARVKTILSKKEFRLFNHKIGTKNSFWENIFSIKNRRKSGKKRKYITIFGHSFLIQKNIAE